MIIKTEGGFYKVRMVYSLEISIVTPGRWDFLKFWENKRDLTATERLGGYKLTMDYLGEDDLRYDASWTCRKRDSLVKLHNEIMKQLEQQDHEIMDRAFEDAVNNLGKGSK